MATSKGSHHAKRLIEAERNLPRNRQELAEDQGSQGRRNVLGNGIRRTRALLGYLHAMNWRKQGKRDAREP